MTGSSVRGSRWAILVTSAPAIGFPSAPITCPCSVFDIRGSVAHILEAMLLPGYSGARLPGPIVRMRAIAVALIMIHRTIPITSPFSLPRRSIPLRRRTRPALLQDWGENAMDLLHALAPDLLDQQGGRTIRDLLDGLVNAGQGRCGVGILSGAVEPDHGELLWHVQPPLSRLLQHAESDPIIPGEDCRRPPVAFEERL